MASKPAGSLSKDEADLLKQGILTLRDILELRAAQPTKVSATFY